ncbi:AMP-binding protein [Reyranella sp.]|uniref:AMP-binding protein n=1 Tax=Reyranella sp. TaxID=1929291 RepID=UPI003BAD2BAF
MHSCFLSQILADHARTRGSHPALVFLATGVDETDRLSHAELDSRVEAVAAGLCGAALSGRSVLVALPPGADFAVLFLACLRAGTVAIPAPYPDTFRHVDRIRAIAADARPAAIVSDEAGLARCAIGLPGMTMKELEIAPGAAAPAEPADIAFVQYTSGSTTAPKGVAITNRNLVANLTMIAESASLDAGCISVTWLPHFHDMGLIGGLCLPLLLGGTAVAMPPQAFIKKPTRWLQAMHRYRANLSGGPSFGYDICTRRPSGDFASMDLSAWRIAYCGAERVRASVLERFSRLLAPAGFDPKAVLPCYGLAEATLMATCPVPGTGVRQVSLERPRPAGSSTFASCGPAVAGSEIRIRMPDETWAAAGEIGEICIRGEHVSPGLWQGERKPPRPFADRIVEGGALYLRTGDLGAMVDGELVPVDRIKDVIAVHGRKIHAADVEATVLEACDAIGGIAAVGLDEGDGERLVVLCEVRRPDMAAVDPAALAATVANVHGMLPDVRLIVPGSLDRTSSGKVARFACKERLLRPTTVGPGAAATVRNDEESRV